MVRSAEAAPAAASAACCVGLLRHDALELVVDDVEALEHRDDLVDVRAREPSRSSTPSTVS